ncbi:MAG: flagellar biosynthetic protein FliR [Chlamydiales bacterium]|jgi:flagellar biosynthetic protein FliR
MSIIAGIPFIPYIHSGQDVIFFFYAFMRVTGLMLLSPLLANNNIPRQARVFLTFLIAVLIATSLYPDYRGENPKYFLPELGTEDNVFLIRLLMTSAKEFGIGYLIGFFFSSILEGLLFAAQSTSIMMGFSMARLLDPVTGTTQTLLGQLYMILASLLMVSLDLHHIFIRILAESFSIVPIGQYQLPYESLAHIVYGSSKMWHYALRFAAIPYSILFLVTVGLGFMAKIMPEMNIFMVGFPLKIFIGYYGLIICVGYFPELFVEAFYEYGQITRVILQQLGPG